MALLIVVFREGTMKQALQNLPVMADQDQLNRVASLLNLLAVDRTADEIEAALARPSARRRHHGRHGPADPRAESGLSGRCASSTARSIDDLFSDGLLNVMAAPEFDRSEKVRQIFAALENRAYLGSLVDSVAQAGTIQIFIGHENSPLEMQDVSLVLAPYGLVGRAVGVVGVLGPTRMPYAQAIASVEFVSGLDERTGGASVCVIDTGRPHGSGPPERTPNRRPRTRTPSRCTAPPHTRSCATQLEIAKGLAAEHLASLQRTAADFANFKRRTAEDREREFGLASESLLRKLLAVADDFDRALDAMPEDLKTVRAGSRESSCSIASCGPSSRARA